MALLRFDRQDFRNGKTLTVHNLPFFVYPLIFVIALISAMFIRLRIRRKIKAVTRERNYLKENGSKVKVHFSDCEIKSREGYDIVSDSEFPTKIDMLDSLSGKNAAPLQRNATVSILVYKYSFGNKKIEFRSELISMSLESLKLRLDQKEYTYVFYDSNNPFRYFFDVDFLYG